MKLLKLNAYAAVSAALLAATSLSVFAKCNDSMDSYIKFSIAGGCNIVNAAAKNKDTKEEHTLYMLGLNEYCGVFSNGVKRKELDLKFPILVGQSVDKCSVKQQHDSINKIKKAYNMTDK